MSFPTQLTILRIILAPVFFYLFSIAVPPLYTWAAVVFIVAAASDWYDGYFARLWKLTTPLGAFLDPLADKILTGAAFIAFATAGLIPLWMTIIVISRDVLMTVFRILSDNVGMSVVTSNFGKVKTFVQMTFISYVLMAHILRSGDFGVTAARFGMDVGSLDLYYYGMLIVTALTVATKVQYIYDNLRVLRAVWNKYLGGSVQG
jgi:CDP-diacylglycerol--glycerol-3-phosphate 3-phosphatidyltransferase